MFIGNLIAISFRLIGLIFDKFITLFLSNCECSACCGLFYHPHQTSLFWVLLIYSRLDFKITTNQVFYSLHYRRSYPACCMRTTVQALRQGDLFLASPMSGTVVEDYPDTLRFSSAILWAKHHNCFAFFIA